MIVPSVGQIQPVNVKESLPCKRRYDLEISIEAVWLEVTVKNKPILVGEFYRLPNSDMAYFNLLLESIDRGYNTNISNIIITGDFNNDMLKTDSNKIKDLIQHFNFYQLTLKAPITTGRRTFSKHVLRSFLRK